MTIPVQCLCGLKRAGGSLQVLTSSALTLVDPDVLGLLDLEQTQAFIVGLLREQLKTVSKGLLRDFEASHSCQQRPGLLY
jgi:hypothetical protein